MPTPAGCSGSVKDTPYALRRGRHFRPITPRKPHENTNNPRSARAPRPSVTELFFAPHARSCPTADDPHREHARGCRPQSPGFARHSYGCARFRDEVYWCPAEGAALIRSHPCRPAPPRHPGGRYGSAPEPAPATTQRDHHSPKDIRQREYKSRTSHMGAARRRTPCTSSARGAPMWFPAPPSPTHSTPHRTCSHTCPTKSAWRAASIATSK